MIGTGVFLKTRAMTCNVGTPALVFAVWIVSGLLVLAGTFCYAEVGSLMPEAGGQYVFVRRAYGRVTGFLLGWGTFAVVLASSTGARADDPQAQPVDAEYSARIREYTTEPFFLTELVDHLPSSETVPSPKKALGYVVGTPEKLTYTKDINAYFRALAAASPRVKVWTIGKSEEGRDIAVFPLAVPAIAWFKQSALFLVLAAIFLIGLGVAFWPRRTDRRAAD